MKQFLFSRYTMPRTHFNSSRKKPSQSLPTPVSPPYAPVAPSSPRLPVASSFGQTMKEGFGFGVGSAIAHRVVGSLLAPAVPIASAAPLPTPVQTLPSYSCDTERSAFERCMKTQAMESFCGQEQIAYTECIRMEKPTAGY